MRPQIGELILGKYRIQSLLADGGMGTIYEARHEVLGTLVAMKVLHPNLAKRPNLVARFLQEARVSATLKSPYIVQVHDVEQGPYGAMLVMELLRGETLQAMLDRQRRLDVPVAIDLAVQMLYGLEVAHAGGVVHRDLKPDNVFLVPGAQGLQVKLLDFGIAKLRTSSEFERGLTRPGVVMGTPEYMAPEQAYSADTVDARADIYALGVMLFEMLAGQRPVAGDEPKAIAQKVFAGHVTALSAVLPSLPINLVSAVHRAMAPSPKGRFGSAAEMRAALQPFLAPQPTPAQPTGHTTTSVLTPGSPAASLPPAPTQPNPGSMPSPNHGGTPVFSAAPMAPSPTGVPATPHLTGPMSGWVASPEPARSVPKTLPPEAPGPAPTNPGATAPRDPLPMAFAPAPTRPPEHTALGQPGAPAMTNHGYGYGPPPGATAVHNPYQGGTNIGLDPMPTATPPPPPAHASRRGPSVGLLAALAGLAGGLVVVVILALRGQGRDDPPPQPTPLPPPTLSAPASSTASLPPALPTFPPSQPTTTVTTGGPGPKPQPQPRDGGTDGGSDGGTLGGLPLPQIPSALPPIPSALPPIPTSITIPLPF